MPGLSAGVAKCPDEKNRCARIFQARCAFTVLFCAWKILGTDRASLKACSPSSQDKFLIFLEYYLTTMANAISGLKERVPVGPCRAFVFFVIKNISILDMPKNNDKIDSK